MLYKVKAKIHEDKMKAFFTALTDGSIESQKPDGPYILKAMQEALMADDKTLSWYESCYCATPLRHERETVYDTYLYDFAATLVYEVKDDIEGKCQVLS
jgi:hypothetical protein